MEKKGNSMLEELFDVTIEAQSYIWLRFPDTLLQEKSRDQMSSILKVIS